LERKVLKKLVLFFILQRMVSKGRVFPWRGEKVFLPRRKKTGREGTPFFCRLSPPNKKEVNSPSSKKGKKASFKSPYTGGGQGGWGGAKRGGGGEVIFHEKKMNPLNGEGGKKRFIGTWKKGEEALSLKEKPPPKQREERNLQA